jgi:hypothetical protein
MSSPLQPSIPMFGVVESGMGLGVVGEYDPGITPEVDRKIRNMPEVVAYVNGKAQELLDGVGSPNFETILMGETYPYPVKHPRRADQQRARAYVCPSNGKGIHEELTQAVLLKAALGMAGR